MTRYVNDLQKYKKLAAKDEHAVQSYEAPMWEQYDIIMDLKEKAEKEGIESALFYGINDAYEVGFIRGIRYEKSRVKRSGASKTGAEPTGSAQTAEQPVQDAKFYTLTFRMVNIPEEKVRSLNNTIRALGIRITVMENETSDQNGELLKRIVKDKDGKVIEENMNEKQIRPTDPEKKQYFILIHDYEGCIIAEDAYISTRPEAEAEAARRVDQLGGRSYTIAEPVNPVYTMEAWQHDVNFKAYAGQEVTEDIYRRMYNSLLPLDLTEERAAEIRNKYGAEIETGFLMAEPYGSNESGLTYLCFGRSGGKCYFFGEVNR